MASLNKVILIGRLGSDPEKTLLNGGSTVAKFSLATSEKYKDQEGNQQEKTEWHRIVMWNKLADLAEKYLSKGKQVYIEGSLKTNEWNDKDGNKRFTTEVNAQTMQFLDSKSGNGGNSSNNNYKSNSGNQQTPYIKNSQFEDDFMEDDIPF